MIIVLQNYLKDKVKIRSSELEEILTSRDRHQIRFTLKWTNNEPSADIIRVENGVESVE